MYERRSFDKRVDFMHRRREEKDWLKRELEVSNLIHSEDPFTVGEFGGSKLKKHLKDS